MDNATRDFRPSWQRGWRGLAHRAWRWPLVTAVDRIRPDACWADLCMWSFFYGDALSDVLQSAEDCMAARTQVGGQCWCGKMCGPRNKEQSE